MIRWIIFDMIWNFNKLITCHICKSLQPSRCSRLFCEGWMNNLFSWKRYRERWALPCFLTVIEKKKKRRRERRKLRGDYFCLFCKGGGQWMISFTKEIKLFVNPYSIEQRRFLMPTNVRGLSFLFYGFAPQFSSAAKYFWDECSADLNVFEIAVHGKLIFSAQNCDIKF